MLIGGQMGWRKSNFFILLVIMLCASLVVSLEYRRTAEEVFLSRLVDPATGEINEDLAEQLWISCRPDFQLLTEANEDHNLCFAEETSGRTNNLKGCSLSKETIPKFIKVLQPQSKQTLLDCIRKNSILFPFSVENGGFDSHRHGKYVDSFNVRPVVPKRNLLQSGTPPDSPAEPPSSSPAASPEEAPPPVSASPNRSPPPRKPFFPRGGFDESPPAPSENVSAPPISGADVEPDNGNSNHRSIVIAVVLTASVTFVFAALFFFCCTKFFRRHGGVGQNDERPLLSLSLSDYSAGSSHKSFGYGNSVKEENGSQWNNNLYSKSDSLPAIDEAQALGSVGVPAKTFTESVDTSSNVNGLLPPPPGRTGSTLKPPPGREGSTLKPPPGREGSTLKPPPGRADPLPPEPPAALRPPSSRTGPPPPPPVPPAVKVSGSTGAPPPGPPPPPMAPRIKPGAPPPPPLKGGPRPPPPIPSGSKIPRPPTAKLPGDDDPDHSKAKLKPFFWDKVLANPDHSMVWHQIKSGSFQFNEEMIETLFGYTNDKNKNDLKKDPSQDASSQYIQIINPKKAQNLSILLRALNVTIEEVCDALDEGNELPVELLQTLLKMAPTADEELKLRLYCGDLSQLGPAERFLKALVDIPFAFKRLEALLFMCTLEEEVTTTKESFGILEVACKELRSSRLFLKLLEAVLKTGNRMNVGTFRGGAQAFKLDTLLKLSDVKGTDGKTTLLHFVVQEIIRSEGVRAARAAKASRTLSGVSVKTEDLLEEISPDTEDHFRDLGLQVVSRLSSELENVKKAAIIDADSLTGTVAKLGHSLLKTRDFLNKEMNSLEEDGGFQEVLKSSVQNAEVDVTLLLEEEKRIMALVKSTGDYFHGNAGKDEGLRLFVIVRDFLIMLDKVCKEVGEAQKKSAKALKKEASTASAHSDTRPQSSPDVRSRLFPAIAERRMDNSSSSSDDES